MVIRSNHATWKDKKMFMNMLKCNINKKKRVITHCTKLIKDISNPKKKREKEMISYDKTSRLNNTVRL